MNANSYCYYFMSLGTPSLSAKSKQKLNVVSSMQSLMGFPGSWDSKEFACSAGDAGWIPGSGRSPGEGNGYPLQYSCLENPMDEGAWRAIVHGVAKSQKDTTEWLHFHFHAMAWVSVLSAQLLEGSWYSPSAIFLLSAFREQQSILVSLNPTDVFQLHPALSVCSI